MIKRNKKEWLQKLLDACNSVSACRNEFAVSNEDLREFREQEEAIFDAMDYIEEFYDQNNR